MRRALGSRVTSEIIDEETPTTEARDESHHRNSIVRRRGRTRLRGTVGDLHLRVRGDAEVLKRVRYVRDGNLVTSAGVSAGIDMALWLVGQIFSPNIARTAQRAIEYDPAPPYCAEV